MTRIPYFDIDKLPKRIQLLVEDYIEQHHPNDRDLLKYCLGVDNTDPLYRKLDKWLKSQRVSATGSVIFDRYAY